MRTDIDNNIQTGKKISEAAAELREMIAAAPWTTELPYNTVEDLRETQKLIEKFIDWSER